VALAHERLMTCSSPAPASKSPTDRVRLCRAEFEHTVQNVARKTRLYCLGARLTTSEPASEESLVAEEGVLGTGLEVIARLLLPLASSDLARAGDCSIPRATRRRRCSGLHGCFRRRNHDRRTSRGERLVHGPVGPEKLCRLILLMVLQPSVMLYRMVRFLHFLVSFFTANVRTRLSLQLEIAALRHQLSVYRLERRRPFLFAQPIGCSGPSWRGSGRIGDARCFSSSLGHWWSGRRSDFATTGVR